MWKLICIVKGPALIEWSSKMGRRSVYMTIKAIFVVVCFTVVSWAGHLEYRGTAMWSQPRQILYDDPYLYCVFQYGLAVYEVGDTIKLRSRTYLEGDSQRMVKAGNLVFIACGAGGLQILDVQDPANPQLISTFNPSGYVSDIVVRDTVAFIAASTDGIITADISNVSMPMVIGQLLPPSPTGRITLLGVSPDGKTIVSNWGTSSELSKLAVIDATNLDSLDLMDTIQIQEKPRYFAFQGDTAFIAAWMGSYSRIVSLDVSSPSSSVILDNDVIGDQLSGFSLLNSRAIIPFIGQLRFYDFSDPTNLRLVKTLPVPGVYRVDQSEDHLVVYAGFPIEEVQYYDITGDTSRQTAKLSVEYGSVENGAICGDYALIQCRHLQVLSVAGDGPLTLLDSLDLSGHGLLAVGDNLAVASGYGSTAVILDLSVPGYPKPSDTVDFGTTSKIVIHNHHLFVAGYYSLSIHDALDPTNIRLIGGCGGSTRGIRDLAVSNGRAYVADGKSISIIDISDPALPVIIDSFAVEASRIAAVSKMLYCAADSTVSVYDLSVHSQPVLRSSYVFGGQIISSLDFRGNVVAAELAKAVDEYAYDFRYWVELVDFSDHNYPVRTGTYQVPEVGQLSFDGQRLLFTSNMGAVVLTNKCCEGSAGNMDCDRSGVVDISDVTSLIDFLFISLTPLCCPAQGDLDQSGNTDIADLTQLIESLFITIVPLPSCSN